jgi:Zn-dependent protease with chaperone function
MTATIGLGSCPDCGERLTTEPGFPVWCAGCDWGLAGSASMITRRRRFWHARLERWSARLVESLYQQVSRSPASRPGWNAARVASYLVACVIHACSLGLFVLGCWILLTMLNIITFIPAVAALMLAVELRPRLGSLRKARHIRRRGDTPVLFALLDRVAAELKARPVDVVIVSTAFNAAYATVGLRRRRVLHLGLPLWELLPGDQKIALLGHELAHGVNGDSRHGLIVGSSVAALARLRRVFLPGRSRYPRNAFLELFARIIQIVISSAIGAVLALQNLITLRARQRAEYYADMLAGRLASPASAAGMLDILVTGRSTYSYIAERQAFREDSAGYWDELRAAIAAVPETERERRRRVSARKPLRIDESHPPAHLRIATLHGREQTEPALRLAAGEEEQIRAELAGDYARVAAAFHTAANALR